MRQVANEEVLKEAVKRHDIDAGIFQGKYFSFPQGKYTDSFVYGRYQLFEEIERLLGRLPKGARVLDLGSGTGHFSDYIRRRGLEVVGIDPSIKMLSFARRNFPEIEYIEGYSNDLPFADEHFDCIVSIEVLRYLNAAEVIRAYREMWRTLRPGGMIMATHVNRLAGEGYFLYYQMQRLAARVLGKGIHNTYFTSAAREERCLRALGFTEVESVGRMSASIRIAYKLCPAAGRMWARASEALGFNQRTVAGFGRNLRGHLVVVARKPQTPTTEGYFSLRPSV